MHPGQSGETFTISHESYITMQLFGPAHGLHVSLTQGFSDSLVMCSGSKTAKDAQIAPRVNPERDPGKGAALEQKQLQHRKTIRSFLADRLEGGERDPILFATYLSDP